MLNLFIYATFASAGLIVTGELLNDASSQYRLISIVIQSIGTLSLVFLLPLLFIFISKDDGYNKARWGARRIVFHSLSWLFYALCIFLSICIGLGWWKFISRQSVGSSALVVGCLALISSVFLISSLHEVEATSALKSLATRLNAIRLFFTMNVMLAIIASVLAILAERSLINKRNNRLAAIEAVLSAGLFVIVLFNTHGLGGRLMHNDVSQEEGSGKISASPWTFFQPFVGGVKFVILQIISWLFFAFSLVFGFLFILSTFTIGMEIFLGVEAIAGLCCIISEILMIISIHVFEKVEEPSKEIILAQSERIEKVSIEETDGLSIKSYDLSSKEITLKIGIVKQQQWYSKQKLRAVVHHLHALVVTVLVVNMQHLPFLGIVPVFFTAGMSVKETFLHWFAACVSIGLYTLAFAYFKARYENHAFISRLIIEEEATQ